MTSHCFTRRWIQPQNKARGHRSHGVRDPEGAPKMGSHGLCIQRVRGHQDIDELANVFAKLLRLPSNLRSLKLCEKVFINFVQKWTKKAKIYSLTEKRKLNLVARYATSEKSQSRIDFWTRATLLRHNSFLKIPCNYCVTTTCLSFMLKKY